jgi:hypothetical protein
MMALYGGDCTVLFVFWAEWRMVADQLRTAASFEPKTAYAIIVIYLKRHFPCAASCAGNMGAILYRCSKKNLSMLHNNAIEEYNEASKQAYFIEAWDEKTGKRNDTKWYEKWRQQWNGVDSKCKSQNKLMNTNSQALYKVQKTRSGSEWCDGEWLRKWPRWNSKPKSIPGILRQSDILYGAVQFFQMAMQKVLEGLYRPQWSSDIWMMGWFLVKWRTSTNVWAIERRD